jgi:hypothetical protein
VRTVSGIIGVSLIVAGLSLSDVVVRAADLGSPPSGEIPILYNDHTVYAKPDRLTDGRVLAALAEGGHALVPLATMFGLMGATVAVDGRTLTAVKGTTRISVTVGVPTVIIDGESRPLDVPPVLVHGIILAPVRVLSEALGAYVQWVPERRVVVVRYLPAVPAPVPTVEPTAVPTIAPPAPIVTAAPTPSPRPSSYTGFIEAAFARPLSYNEFSDGADCPRSYTISGVITLKSLPIAVKIDYRDNAYLTTSNLLDNYGNHYTQFATIDGGTAHTPEFLGRQTTLDTRLEYQIAKPRVYIGVGYVQTTTNYGYPNVGGVGVGIEKLPDLHPGLSPYASAFYYPSASANYTIADPTSSHYGDSYTQRFAITKYDIGGAVVFAHVPVYLYGGYAGDVYTERANAPIGQTHAGPYLGLGVKF